MLCNCAALKAQGRKSRSRDMAEAYKPQNYRPSLRYLAYHHPEGNSYIERFHRSLKEEEVGLSEYRNLEEARESIARYLREYNHHRPHRGLRDRTPREAYVSLQSDLRNQALPVQF